MAASSYPDPKVIEASRNFVNVIAHRDTRHGDKEITVGKEKVRVCKEYLSIPCSVHVDGYKTGLGKFFKGNLGTPTTVFCDPTGKEIARKLGGLGAAELIKEMEAVLRQVPGEHISFKDWSQGKKDLADGDAWLEKKEFKKAVDLFVKVNRKGKAFKDLAEEHLKRANEAGEKEIKDAAELQDVDKRKAALKKIVESFKSLEVSEKAKKLLDETK